MKCWQQLGGQKGSWWWRSLWGGRRLLTSARNRWYECVHCI